MTERRVASLVLAGAALLRDTALSITHTQASGTANLSDTTTTVAVNAGDRISMRFEETAGLDPIVTPSTQSAYNVTLELH